MALSPSSATAAVSRLWQRQCLTQSILYRQPNCLSRCFSNTKTTTATSRPVMPRVPPPLKKPTVKPTHSPKKQQPPPKTTATTSRPVMPRVPPPLKKPTQPPKTQQQPPKTTATTSRPVMPRVPPPKKPTQPPPKRRPAVEPTMAGTGTPLGTAGPAQAENKTPVGWAMLLSVGLAAASAVAYYKIERERRLERAMGQVVSSESTTTTSSKDGGKEGWSPSPGMAKRKFEATKCGWFPVDDGWSAAGKPAIGGPWSLVDLEGNLVTEQSFAGKWILLYFGFARCPDICPSEMNKVGQVLDTLKRDRPDLYAKVKPVFVSIDPARDSLHALREYAKDFHPDYICLTGTPEQVQQMAKKYRVYVSKAEETADEDYLVDHSIVIYFHDDTGDLSDCFTQSMRATDVVGKVIEKMTYVPKTIS